MLGLKAAMRVCPPRDVLECGSALRGRYCGCGANAVRLASRNEEVNITCHRHLQKSQVVIQRHCISTLTCLSRRSSQTDIDCDDMSLWSDDKVSSPHCRSADALVAKISIRHELPLIIE